MRRVTGWILIGCLLLAGCGKQAGTGTAPAATQTAGGEGAGSAGGSSAGAGNGGSATGAATVSQPVPIEAGVAKLTPENTKIGFVGTHVGEKPDPRVGGFNKFTGQAEIDPATNTLKAVAVDIDTGSLWTQFPALTNHLNSPDFFDTREYPTAKFVSNSITAGSGEEPYAITGNLTLLATTKEISFPATVTISDEGLKLKAEFTIDRVEFGMSGVPDRVEKTVALSVAIGESAQTSAAEAAGAPAGGGFDMTAFFQRMDADGDGKLTGEEINNQLRHDMQSLDSDRDGAISLEELEARMQRAREATSPGSSPAPNP